MDEFLKALRAIPAGTAGDAVAPFFGDVIDKLFDQAERENWGVITLIHKLSQLFSGVKPGWATALGTILSAAAGTNPWLRSKHPILTPLITEGFQRGGKGIARILQNADNNKKQVNQGWFVVEMFNEYVNRSPDAKSSTTPTIDAACFQHLSAGQRNVLTATYWWLLYFKLNDARMVEGIPSDWIPGDMPKGADGFAHHALGALARVTREKPKELAHILPEAESYGEVVRNPKEYIAVVVPAVMMLSEPTLKEQALDWVDHLVPKEQLRHHLKEFFSDAPAYVQKVGEGAARQAQKLSDYLTAKWNKWSKWFVALYLAFLVFTTGELVLSGVIFIISAGAFFYSPELTESSARSLLFGATVGVVGIFFGRVLTPIFDGIHATIGRILHLGAEAFGAAGSVARALASGLARWGLLDNEFVVAQARYAYRAAREAERAAAQKRAPEYHPRGLRIGVTLTVVATAIYVIMTVAYTREFGWDTRLTAIGFGALVACVAEYVKLSSPTAMKPKGDFFGDMARNFIRQMTRGLIFVGALLVLFAVLTAAYPDIHPPRFEWMNSMVPAEGARVESNVSPVKGESTLKAKPAFCKDAEKAGKHLKVCE